MFGTHFPIFAHFFKDFVHTMKEYEGKKQWMSLLKIKIKYMLHSIEPNVVLILLFYFDFSCVSVRINEDLYGKNDIE